MKNKYTLKWQFILTTFLILVGTAVISMFLFVIISHLPVSRFFERSPWLRLGLILIACTIIGTIISAVISERILTPLHQVIEGTKEVSRGNFNISVDKLEKHHELMDLIENFNQMTKALNSVEIMHSDFINNFSHEFKTPIMAIQGFAKQLQNPTLSEAERLEFTDIIISETSRLAHLSTNILLLANLENHEKLNLTLQSYALDEQLRQCLLILQQDWEEKELALQLEIEPVMFYGDQEMMASLWLNLLTNAIKFSRQNGQLKIASYRLGNQIKVKIEDEGIGMSDDVRQHIFDKFYQGEESHQGIGSGLGMPIVKQIAALHHGSIHVKSVINEGTIFTLIFENNLK